MNLYFETFLEKLPFVCSTSEVLPYRLATGKDTQCPLSEIQARFGKSAGEKLLLEVVSAGFIALKSRPWERELQIMQTFVRKCSYFSFAYSTAHC